ncbi:MAG: tRNA lysidine(34) synthetase TilS [Bacteroidota bacterium]
MLDKFLQEVETKSLFTTESRLLVAVSGGIDSMTLCHLLLLGGFKFSVAHCNFKLRGDESEQDEQFVMEWCNIENVPFYSRAFTTKSYAIDHGLSIQMAARELRYLWFDEIVLSHSYEYVLTAHNLDDSLETSLFNFTKGTGLRGLTGIPTTKSNIIRPLINFSRKEINEFAKKIGLIWRDDSSNADSKYHRNRLRHNIIPELRRINPSILSTYASSKARLTETYSYLRGILSKKFSPVVTRAGQDIYIRTKKIKSVVELDYLLHPYNFRYSQLNDILNACLASVSGKLFYSTSHQLNIDRGQILISPLISDFSEKIICLEDKNLDNEFYNLEMSVLPVAAGILFESNSASLDFDKLNFPLKLRKWRSGDSFYPLGMKGKKKVSDYMIDSKIPLNLKERVGVLESDGQIIWLAGHRIDDRFKVTDQTKRIYQIVLK